MEKYITRYTIEYYACVDDDEDRLVDYIYADSHDKAIAVFEQKHGTDCVIIMCKPYEVPARYKDYDDFAIPSLSEKLVAACRAVEEARTNEAGDNRGQRVVDLVKD